MHQNKLKKFQNDFNNNRPIQYANGKPNCQTRAKHRPNAKLSQAKLSREVESSNQIMPRWLGFPPKVKKKDKQLAQQTLATLIVLLYPDILNFTFQNVKNLKCKIFLIDFLDELGNFKQKKFYTSKCKFLFTFYNNGPLESWHLREPN